MSPDFEPPFSRPVDIYVPFAFTPRQMSDEERGEEFSLLVARLKPGETIEGLNAQMAAIVRRNLERLPQVRASAEVSGFAAFAVDYRQQRVGDVLLVLYPAAGGCRSGPVDCVRERGQSAADARNGTPE